jgi:outer membrane protein TolC
MNNRRTLLALALVLAAAAAAAAPPPEARTLSVREAVRLALERAPEIAVAESSTREAEAAADEAASALRPRVALNTTPGYSVGLPLSLAGEVPSAFGARAGMTLYDVSLRGEALEARARVAETSATLTEARAEVVRRTVAACAKLQTDTDREAAARRRVEAREAMTRRARALLREGRVTDLDADKAALDEARARQKLDAVLSDLELDRFELARLVGLPPGTPLAVSEDPAEVLPEAAAGQALTAAIARDATLKSLSEQADALTRSARLLDQLFKPSVNAEVRYAFVPRSFGYDKYYLSFQENVASVGVSVVLPILTGGRESARAAQSRARLAHVEAERRVREGELASDLRSAEAAAGQAHLALSLSRRGAALAEESVRQARSLAREGRGTPDAVEQAELALVESQEEALAASREDVAARLRLLKLTGELLPAFQTEPSSNR